VLTRASLLVKLPVKTTYTPAARRQPGTSTNDTETETDADAEALETPPPNASKSTPPPPNQSDSCVSSAAPRMTQCADGSRLGSRTNATKLVEWPVVASTPRRSAVLGRWVGGGQAGGWGRG